VAVALVMLVIEHSVKAYRITAVEGVGLRAAWWVGVAQCCSLVPGVSRSARNHHGWSAYLQTLRLLPDRAGNRRAGRAGVRSRYARTGARLRAWREGWLPGQDSNLRPIGYENPNISAGLGLSHHPPEESIRGGCRALMRLYWLGSSASSLCTFLPTRGPSAGFAQDYHSEASKPRGRLP